MVSYLFCLTIDVVIYTVCSYQPIVNELEAYVKTNDTFAAELNATFSESVEKNTTNNDMYSTFNKWLNNVPTVNEQCSINTLSNVLSPFTSTISGSQILKYNTSIQWLQSYLNDWKLFLDSNESVYIVTDWMKCVNMTEYLIPINGYSSFNDFFYRQINASYRPIANITDDSVITSPADGFVYFIERNISLETVYNVKHENYNITQMLNNSKFVNKFVGGDLMQIVLTFDNYHRYHSPITGFINKIDQISGWYFVQNDGFNDHSLDNSNRRGVVYTSDIDKYIIATVHIGMMEVSSVNYNIKPNTNITKGDEVGFFAFGGSSIVLIFEPGYIDKFTVKINDDVIMGQQIAFKKRL
eukprot:87795_1